MNTSINRLNREFKAIADAHIQVNKYFWGEFDEAINDSTVNYPLMCCYYTGNGMKTNTVPINLFVIIVDKYFKNQRQGNLNDVESDTLQVARDVFEVVANSRRWRDLGRVDGATFNKFVSKGADEVAGGVLQMQFTLYDNQSVCDLPMIGYDFDQQSDFVVCAEVLIINSDGTFSVTSASGTTYELPDTSYSVYFNTVFQETFTLPTLS